MPLDDCRLVSLPTFRDSRGALSVIEGENLPFPIRRFYYVYSIPAGQRRGGHAHLREEELILPLAGAFSLTVDDGRDRRTHRLDDPSRGLLVPAMIWHELHDFSAGAVCAVLASHRYDAADYLSTYEEFLAAVG